MIVYWILIFILLIIICVLVASLYLLIKKMPRYLINKKEKDFILFTIDMYIDYAKDLDIQSEEQHGQIVGELNKIKDKYFENEGN